MLITCNSHPIRQRVAIFWTIFCERLEGNCGNQQDCHQQKAEQLFAYCFHFLFLLKMFLQIEAGSLHGDGTRSGALIYGCIIYAFPRFVNREFTKNYKMNYKIISAHCIFLFFHRNKPGFSTLFSYKNLVFPITFSIIKIFVTYRLFLHRLWIAGKIWLQMVTISSVLPPCFT